MHRSYTISSGVGTRKSTGFCRPDSTFKSLVKKKSMSFVPDINRSVPVPVQKCTTSGAGPVPVLEGQGLVNKPTYVTGFTAWKTLGNFDQVFSLPQGLVLKHSGKHPPSNVPNTFTELQGPGHILHIKSFQANQVIVIGYLTGQFVKKIFSGICDKGIDTSYFNFLFFILARIIYFSGQLSLFTSPKAMKRSMKLALPEKSRQEWWRKQCDEVLYRHPQGEIVCADALSVLNSLSDRCADIVFLDPPFNLGKRYGKNGSHNDRKKESDYIEYMTKIIFRSAEILKDGGALYFYHIPKWAIRLSPYIEQCLDFRHWIAIS